MGSRAFVLIKRLLLAFLCGSLLTQWVKAEEAPIVQVRDVRIEYTFNVQLHMSVTFESEVPLAAAVLFLQQEEQSEIAVGPVEVNSKGNADFTYDIGHNPLQPFTMILYWFAVTSHNGQHLLTPKYQFFYKDNRFNWQTLEDDLFHVHWYKGDVIFAQEVLTVAQNGKARAQEFLPLDLPGEVDIYVYDNTQTLQSVLRLTTQKWVAGHAYPESGVILVSLPNGPEQRLEMERQIPHELMHLMLYQRTGKEYANLPMWLTEGLASVTELYPNPDYQIILEDAYRNDTLLPMSSLCVSFPNETAEALLAYAEAASFVRYLHTHHGTSGLEKLIHEYTVVSDCDQGIERALGASLAQMETRWKQEVFIRQKRGTEIESLIPWITLLLIVITAPLILSLLSLGQRKTKPMGG